MDATRKNTSVFLDGDFSHKEHKERKAGGPTSVSATIDRSGWKRVMLGEVLTYEQPYPYIVHKAEYVSNGTPVLTPGKTFILGYTTETDGICRASSDAPRILFDDFLTISRLVQFDFKVKSSAVKILLPVSTSHNLRFIFYAMSRLQFEVTDHQRHWINQFSKLEIQVPTRQEQDRIADAIDSIDTHISALQSLIAKYEAIKKATVNLLLKPKAGWQEKPLGDLSFIKTGGKNTQDAVASGQYPFFVRSPNVERINTYSYDGEAVLVAGDGVGAGKVFHYINGKHDCHQRVYRVCDFNSEVLGLYIYRSLSELFPIYMERRNDKASVDSLRLPAFKEFLVHYPNIDEQKRIVGILDSIDGTINGLKSQLAKAQDIKQGMMSYFFG